MLVQCPECVTKYNFDETKIAAAGSKVRCTRCSHVFTVFPPESEPAPAAVQAPGSDMEQALEDDLAAMFGTEAESSPAPRANSEKRAAVRDDVDEEMLADLKGAFQQSLTDDDTDSFGGHAEKKKKRSTLPLVFLVLVLLLGTVAGGVYFFRPDLLTQAGITAEPAGSEVQAVPEGVKSIALENVRQYFVPNEKDGQLFIVEGKAVNNFPEARDHIRLRASLFDKAGKVVESMDFMCGNVVSLYQLQVSSRADIEKSLSANVGILTHNTNVQPGASVPFMVVFFHAPDVVEEFGLEVIQSTKSQP